MLEDMKEKLGKIGTSHHEEHPLTEETGHHHKELGEIEKKHLEGKERSLL